jgi:hypothetical protein
LCGDVAAAFPRFAEEVTVSSSEQPQSPIAEFRGRLSNRAWPRPAALDALLRECVRILFAQCHGDYRTWLSVSDLRSELYTVLQRELPSYGIPACAVHSEYSFRLARERMEAIGRRGRAVAVDLAIVVPSTIRLVQGRHWEAELAAAMEIKRSCERYDEVKIALDKLAALRDAQAPVQVYLILMGYRNKQEHLAAAVRAAAQMNIPLLYDNYWGPDDAAMGHPVDQPELV